MLCTAETGDETIGTVEDDSAGGVGAETFLATFLTAVLVATFLAAVFVATFLAAFLATRLGVGAVSPAVPSWLLLLIRNQLKGRCAARMETIRMRVEREFYRPHRHRPKTRSLMVTTVALMFLTLDH